MKFDNQLRYGSSVIAAYRGEMPLHAWLKNYFREHKQMGSRDRKLISGMVYGFYRLGHALSDAGSPVTAELSDTQIRERILAGLFLCNIGPSELLAYFKPEWNQNTGRSPEEKIAIYNRTGKAAGSPPESSNLFQATFDPERIFPWREELSGGVDSSAFCISFLHQPDLFLRIRPGYEAKVRKTLLDKKVDFEFLHPFTIRLPNGSKTGEWFTVNKEVVIQDYSSQRTGSYLKIDYSEGRAVWDACAASGGKSLLAHDVNPEIDLTVSDIRESILHNLRDRFRDAGIRNYRSFVSDLSGKIGVEPGEVYDLIIADTPCSGSGTWGRTPEELYFFDKKKIAGYRDLQRKIVLNLAPAVRPGGRLVYITCSVFKEENEGQITFIEAHTGLKLERTELLKGYDQCADTLFVARFVAP